MQNKRKIINDPVHGFISIPDDLLFDLIEHPYVQRLRRIKQLGLSHLVYPGAMHTRFIHALGAMHLMSKAMVVLENKGIPIDENEVQAAQIAILLHDIGHGPFSHALEHSIVDNITHEDISHILMKKLNKEFGGQLQLAIEMFRGNYSRNFFHELIAGQIDVDRLDYLQRDSLFSGVVEGMVGLERLLKMLNVQDDQLVLEEKALYSVEKFLVARRFMYWQVYLHKTVLSAEYMLMLCLKRATWLARNGAELPATEALTFFLRHPVGKDYMDQSDEAIHYFTSLDDNDIVISVKQWSENSDFILSFLAQSLLNRKLFRIEMADKPFAEDYLESIRKKCIDHFNIPEEDSAFLFFSGEVKNHAYNPKEERIKIKLRDGNMTNLNTLSDLLSSRVDKNAGIRYFIIYPKQVIA